MAASSPGPVPGPRLRNAARPELVRLARVAGLANVVIALESARNMADGFGFAKPVKQKCKQINLLLDISLSLSLLSLGFPDLRKRKRRGVDSQEIHAPVAICRGIAKHGTAIQCFFFCFSYVFTFGTLFWNERSRRLRR